MNWTSGLGGQIAPYIRPIRETPDHEAFQAARVGDGQDERNDLKVALQPFDIACAVPVLTGMTTAMQ